MSDSTGTSRRDRPFVFVIGFAKTGTTTITKALNSVGYTSAHWRTGSRQFVGELMRRAKRENKPLLHYLSKYDAFTQMDVTQLGGPCYWPQLEDVARLDAQYPQSKFILNVRSDDDWLRSATTWNNYRKRMTAADLPGLPSGVGDDDSVLMSWRAAHYDAMRTYFAGRPNDFIEFDIASDDSAKLCAFLGIDAPTSMWWGWANRNRKIARK